jgi:hypothetical protein
MSQLSVRKTYASLQVPTQRDIDNIVDDLETFFNVTKLNSDNFQAAGITGSTKLIDGTVTSEVIASGAATTAKITDANITTAKLENLTIATAKIADSNVTTAKIAASAVTTAKIADGAVTRDKLTGALQVDDAHYDITVTSTVSYSQISATDHTSYGRPVMISLAAYYAGSGTSTCFIRGYTASAISSARGGYIEIRDGATVICRYDLSLIPLTSMNEYQYTGGIRAYYLASAGAHTYSAHIKSYNGETWNVGGYLLAYEL